MNEHLAVGDYCYIETLTKYWTGKVTAVSGLFVAMEDCNWVPDTGRFHLYMRGDAPAENEPCGDRIMVVPVDKITVFCKLDKKPFATVK